jgi:hypothetical protein
MLVPLVLLRRFLLGDVAAQFDALDAGLPELQQVPAKWTLLGYPLADVLALAAAGTGMCLSASLTYCCSTAPQQYQFLPPGEWLACAAAVLNNLPQELHKHWLWAIAATALAGLPTLAWTSGRRALPLSAKVMLALLVPAATSLAFMTSLNHVHRSNYGHYIFVSVFLWQGACVLFAVLQWTAVLPDTRRVRMAPYGLLALFCLVAAARHGRPGVDVVRHVLDENIGQHTAELLAERCTHVTGDYWHVWPTMFHANLVLADQGRNEPIWGIAQRCLPTADRWSRVPLAETRIAEIIGDEEPAEATMRNYGVPPLLLDYECKTIRVLHPTLPLSESWPARQLKFKAAPVASNE